jgi:hypothetical protein
VCWDVVHGEKNLEAEQCEHGSGLVMPTLEQQHKIHLERKTSVQHPVRHPPVREGDDKVIWVGVAHPDLLVPDLEEAGEVEENMCRCYC